MNDAPAIESYRVTDTKGKRHAVIVTRGPRYREYHLANGQRLRRLEPGYYECRATGMRYHADSPQAP